MQVHDDDDDELRRIAHLHARAIRSFIGHFEHDLMEVEEIFADVLYLAHQNRESLREASDGQMRSWLLRTARNLGSNRIRRALTRRRLVERLAREPLPFVSAPDDDLIAYQDELAALAQSEKVTEVLSRLREDYRRVIVMQALGMSGPEIGAALGISANAARKRLMRARAILRTSYEAAIKQEEQLGRTGHE